MKYELDLTDERSKALERTANKESILASEYLQNQVNTMCDSWKQQQKQEDTQSLTGLAELMIQLPDDAKLECQQFLMQKAQESGII